MREKGERYTHRRLSDILQYWKIGRVVECTGLENQRTARFRRFESYIFRIAKVAQLVEYDLAKVRVAGSNPVFRSIFILYVKVIKEI